MNNIKQSDMNIIKGMKEIKGIYITVTNTIYRVGITTYKKKMSEKSYKDFQIYVADTMADEIKSAIDKQRFKDKWSKLSFSYMMYKKKKNLSLDIWKATGTLQVEVKAFPLQRMIAVGFKPNDRYKGTKVPINNIAKYVEYGTDGKNRMAPRPLFRNVLTYMRKHIRLYYNRYNKELKKRNTDYLYLDSDKNIKNANKKNKR